MIPESHRPGDDQALARREGRLADPDRSAGTDPRIDTSLLAALDAVGFAHHSAPAPVTRDNTLDDLRGYMSKLEAAFEQLYATLDDERTGDSTVAHTHTSVTGVDGNEIGLFVYRSGAGPAPCVVYLHGGGMSMLSADNPTHHAWCEELAAAGSVVVGVDFRNAAGVRGPHPFPAGLNDCATAVAWVHAHRADLGITSVVLNGESGGANLALATALRAKRTDSLAEVDGVYALAPYISGCYGWDRAQALRTLPSMIENDGYFATCAKLDLMAAVYDPGGTHARNPLCWPYHATVEDVAGLPPHVIAVNELDPLRDEGLAYFRLLQQAGVPGYGHVRLGTTHAAETLLGAAVRAGRSAVVADIVRFARSV